MVISFFRTAIVLEKSGAYGGRLFSVCTIMQIMRVGGYDKVWIQVVYEHCRHDVERDGGAKRFGTKRFGAKWCAEQTPPRQRQP
jgi:hypothetical protein